MKPPSRQGSPDDFQTPPEALEPLFPYLPHEWVVWECACGKGNIVKTLEGKGYAVIGTDILQGYDFCTWQPDRPYHCIVTNPPYSIKQEFLERCYNLSKPFALLLPLTTLETAKRQRLFREYGIEIILFPKRINFHTPSGSGEGSWFATAWFTHGLNIGRQLTFVEDISKNEKDDTQGLLL